MGPGATDPIAAAHNIPDAIQAVKCPRNIPNALMKPYCHFFAYRSMDISAIPMCMAMLANQAKNITCQSVNFDWPSTGTPVQIFSLATCQKSLNDVHPSVGSTASPAATKTRNIHGEQTLEKCASFSKPKIARLVTTAPTMNTTTIQLMLLGYISLNPGIGIPNGSPTAVADTAIIAPARKQNMRALTIP
ncbi:hypothetical protein ES708_21250 [subsurface metagenome]